MWVGSSTFCIFLTPRVRWPRISKREFARIGKALLRALRRTPQEGYKMPGKLGLPEILLILFIALLIFGPSKLADLGKGIGEGIKNFKSAVKDGEQGTEKKS
jgi:sec-independent protein translocase protein TatA